MEMHPTQQHFRIKIAGLKAHLIRRLGPGLSKQYLYYLNKLFSLKISKFEFNKICCRILGRKNIPFHNHFIRSILKNAYSAKDPPPSHVDDDVNDVTTFGSKETPTHLYLLNATSRTSHSQGFSNGDMLPLSPQKARTGYRDRCETVELSEESGVQNGPVSVCNRNKFEASIKQEGNELYARNQLRGPLGLVFSPDIVSLAHNAITLPCKSKCITASNSGLLLNNLTLRERMEQIAALQGLESLSTDCVGILNNGLNAYLKHLISSCVKLVSARSEQEVIKNGKFVAPSNLANGFGPGHNIPIHNSSMLMDVTPKQRSNTVVSLQDFRVAMELNPQQLGEDWPCLLEKICLRSYDE